jgi:fermentation-respiration switch protein FrsA (DUF1100 family)
MDEVQPSCNGAAAASLSATTPYRGRGWHWWLRSFAVASGGLLSATIAGALYTVNTITRASRVNPFDNYTFTPYELDVPWEDVRIPTQGTDSLAGWWLPRPASQQVIVVCYGYRNRRADMLGVGAALWRHGYNVLLFDYHGHGEHAGSRITLGYRELADALAAMRYACNRLPGARLGLIGYSMGAAIAIMAAARDPRAEVVVADSPFAAQRNPINRRLHQRLKLKWSGQPVLFIADYVQRWLLGYRFRDVEPLREIGDLGDRPILLIHGTADSIIDYQDSVMLYEAAPGPRELWLVQGVEHCGAYFLDRPAYIERVLQFLHRSLGRPAGQQDPARQHAG